MKYSKASSIFALIVGMMMLFMWVFFIVAGLVPEFETRPAEIILHLIAELTTAAVLITAGLITLKGFACGKWLYPFSIGMLMYTLIVSPGYYLQSGDYTFVAMFAVLFILSIMFLSIHLKSMKAGGNES